MLPDTDRPLAVRPRGMPSPNARNWLAGGRNVSPLTSSSKVTTTVLWPLNKPTRGGSTVSSALRNFGGPCGLFTVSFVKFAALLPDTSVTASSPSAA